MSALLEDLLKMTPEEIQAHNERPTADQLRNK
ncbi:MAG TPA: acyl dehydratase, partial [Dehalococcoidia bacterium]|nr:acyl dehydratase [Dehalococcoidia bacterium]